MSKLVLNQVVTSRQLPFSFRTWGGARKGAGRPPKGKAAGVSHLRRSALSARHPLHVTLRVRSGVASLRSHGLFPAVRKALAAGRERFGFRLVHFSVQSTHLHLIAEARDRLALQRGIQGLSIRVARAVNGQLERKGRLFADRYHARALKTPREVRLALRYVFGNARKHERARRALVLGFVDACSSAPWFGGFSRPMALAFGAERARATWARTSGSAEPPVAPPLTWLLRIGHQRAGPLDVDDAPSS